MIRKKKNQSAQEQVGRKKRWINGAMLAALVAAVAVFLVMLQMEKSVLADYEKETVVTAAGVLAKGSLVESEKLSVTFQEVELDHNLVPEDAVTSAEELIGQSACYSIDAGTILTRGMFEDYSAVAQEMADPVIAGFKAEDLYQVVGGVLRAGDRIHIYRVTTPTGAGEGIATAMPIWEDVVVQGVFDQSGTSIAGDDVASAAARINIYMERADVATFYEELAMGSLRVVKSIE